MSVSESHLLYKSDFSSPVFSDLTQLYDSIHPRLEHKSEEILLEKYKRIKVLSQHGISPYSAIFSVDRKCRIQQCVDICHVAGSRAAFGFLRHTVLSAFQTYIPSWQRFRTVGLLVLGVPLMNTASTCHSLYSSWRHSLVKTLLCLL